jgi:hypothetical protein
MSHNRNYDPVGASAPRAARAWPWWKRLIAYGAFALAAAAAVEAIDCRVQQSRQISGAPAVQR